MFDLTGKTALVTGASGGIGGAIARALHAQGATVVLSGTRADALEAVKAELGARAFIAPANLSDSASPTADARKYARAIVEQKRNLRELATTLRTSGCSSGSVVIVGGPNAGACDLLEAKKARKKAKKRKAKKKLKAKKAKNPPKPAPRLTPKPAKKCSPKTARPATAPTASAATAVPT